jgi:DNA-binding beta-propeller fold protein YncE
MNLKQMFRTAIKLFAAFLLAAVIFHPTRTFAFVEPANRPFDEFFGRGLVVVANRASGTISVIDARTDTVVATPALPFGPNRPEPMYVVYTSHFHRVFVGDRANNRVVVFDADDFSVEETIAAGAGVFHMWADKHERQLWVNNDIDKTITVINARTLGVMKTIPTPADLVALGGRPHDVILDPRLDYAYVSMIGVAGANDYVVKYSTDTFREVARAAVGKDPHLSLSEHGDLLYVPCQLSNRLVVLNRYSMTPLASLDIPGTHGAGMPGNGRRFYTTNLPGGGVRGLFAVDTITNRVVGWADTPYPTPHNIALTPNGRKLYLTHSGPTANKVTIYTVSNWNPYPVFAGEATVGLNPFGLAFVPHAGPPIDF